MDAAQIPAHLDPASVSESSIKTSTVEFGNPDKSKTGRIAFELTSEISFDLVLDNEKLSLVGRSPHPTEITAPATETAT